MQSGQPGNSINQDAPAPPTVQAKLPSASDILAGMKDADNPLTFIQENLKALAEKRASEPRAIVAEIEAKRAEEKVKEEDKPETLKEAEIPQPTEVVYDLDPKSEPTKESEVSEPTEEPLPEEVTETDKEINFKKLRATLAEVQNQAKEYETKAKEYESKLQKYETGEDFPEVLKKKDERITELEKYERLHALKLSPAYKEAYIKPLEGLKIELGELAADYEIPPEVLDEAVNITNKRELNAFLSEHFDDPGVLEAKGIIVRAQRLLQDASEAEREPATALQNLTTDYENIQAQRTQRAKASIVEASREAWIESLLAIRKEGKAVGLIARENDEIYNKQRVEPILQAAASEYGRLIRELAEAGLPNLPKSVAFAIANMAQRAHDSAVSNELRDAVEQQAQELFTNVQRTTNYLRPQVGSSGMGGSGAPGPMQPTTPQDAADIILNKVLANK